MKTSGLATGADGASSTSTAQTITTPFTASAVGFSTGSGFGEGASYTAATDVSAKTPFGSTTGKSTVLASSDLGVSRGWGGASPGEGRGRHRGGWPSASDIKTRRHARTLLDFGFVQMCGPHCLQN